jgi:colanic acid biosynthesis glycosyl transferase WcaI
MRILFLTQWFQPEPLFKGLPFAKALRDKGHEVEVITGFPNYPGGRIYPGYRVRFWHREMMCGIPVHRVALYPSHDKSAFRRVLSYLSFSLSAATIGSFLAGRPDVIYVYNLVTLWPAALTFKTLYKCPILYDITDLWPDSVITSRMMGNRFLTNILGRYCMMVYRQASHLVVTTPGMRYELVRRGITEDHISVIYNWCDEENIKPMKRNEALATKYGLSNSYVVMFAGNMGLLQGLETVLRAAELLLQTHAKIKFVFVGGGVERERLKRTAEERHLTNVLFLDWQPPEAMGGILALADVMLVHLKATPLFRMTIPSKVQAYMAAGKPVLLGVRGDAADLVRASGCGKVVEPENAGSVAQGVIELFSASEEERNSMGMNARRHYEGTLSMSAGIRHFEDIFKKVCDKSCL